MNPFEDLLIELRELPGSLLECGPRSDDFLQERERSIESVDQGKVSGSMFRVPLFSFGEPTDTTPITNANAY
jgi:hypothetical protein